MNRVKISIIVPIYNAEKYIERCARSLMEQTQKEQVEILFIDDASSDKSVEILKKVVAEYPNRAEQVRLIKNKSNLGVFLTRKKGINEAKGEYIGWCDADDWYEPNLCESMLQGAGDGAFDIVVCNAWIHDYGNGEERIWEQPKLPMPTPQDAIKNLKCFRSLPETLWDTVIKRNIIKEASDKIIPVSISEDTFILLYCFYYAESAKWLNKPLYHYYWSYSEKTLTGGEIP